MLAAMLYSATLRHPVALEEALARPRRASLPCPPGCVLKSSRAGAWPAGDFPPRAQASCPGSRGPGQCGAARLRRPRRLPKSRAPPPAPRVRGERDLHCDDGLSIDTHRLRHVGRSGGPGSRRATVSRGRCSRRSRCSTGRSRCNRHRDGGLSARGLDTHCVAPRPAPPPGRRLARRARRPPADPLRPLRSLLAAGGPHPHRATRSGVKLSQFATSNKNFSTKDVLMDSLPPSLPPSSTPLLGAIALEN